MRKLSDGNMVSKKAKKINTTERGEETFCVPQWRRFDGKGMKIRQISKMRIIIMTGTRVRSRWLGKEISGGPWTLHLQNITTLVVTMHRTTGKVELTILFSTMVGFFWFSHTNTDCSLLFNSICVKENLLPNYSKTYRNRRKLSPPHKFSHWECLFYS